jgi:hypothetical protein
MFENQNPSAGSQNQGVNPATSAVNAGSAAQNIAPQPAAPANRPAAPADMFSEVEPVPSVADTQRPIPPRPTVFQPKPASPPVSSAPAGDRQYNFEETAPKTNLKKLLVLGGLVVAMAAIVGGGYWGYKKYSGASAGTTDNTQVPAEKTDNDQAFNVQPAEIQQQPEVKTETSPAAASGSENVASGTTPVAELKDTDDDGLTDTEEAALNTNPNAVDSDNDGLFDREEVKVYGTDPLKADTDGDGYSDGVEVKGGFNPLGWGKLFDQANPATNKK